MWAAPAHVRPCIMHEECMECASTVRGSPNEPAFVAACPCRLARQQVLQVRFTHSRPPGWKGASGVLRWKAARLSLPASTVRPLMRPTSSHGAVPATRIGVLAAIQETASPPPGLTLHVPLNAVTARVLWCMGAAAERAPRGAWRPAAAPPLRSKGWPLRCRWGCS